MFAGFGERITVKFAASFVGFVAWSGTMAAAAVNGMDTDREWQVPLAVLGVIGGLAGTIGIMVRFAIVWFSAYGKRVRREGEPSTGDLTKKLEEVNVLLARHDERLTRNESDMQSVQETLGTVREQLAAMPDVIVQRLSDFHQIAERELIQMMAYEPMVLLTAIGMYMVTQSFHVHAIASHPSLLVLTLPGIFLGFLYTLEIKLRKSPFDLSSSHHAHQELVRGITNEFSGRALAMIELAHWYENVFMLGGSICSSRPGPWLASLPRSLCSCS